MFQSRLFVQLRQILMIALTTSVLFSCSETLFVDSGDDLVFDLNKYNNASSQKGGRLYDKWWQEKRISSPVGSNPIWNSTANPDKAAKANGGQWRCVICHGWDYKGRGTVGVQDSDFSSPSPNYSGVKGLDETDPSFNSASVFKKIADGEVTIKNGIFSPDAAPTAHKFLANGKLTIDDVYNLTKFIITVANRDNITKLDDGDVKKGKEVFLQVGSSSNTCGSNGCHAAQTSKNNIVELAKTSEAEFLHKVRTGNPGTPMPGGLSAGEAKDVLAFVKAGINLTVVPPSDFDQNTYNSLGNEAVSLGGLLYDKWWAASSSAIKPNENTNHLLWPSAKNKRITGSETWRCKACHGWDYRGRDGAFANDDEKENVTGIRGIVETSIALEMDTANKVYSYLKEGSSHGFKGLLTVDTNDPNKDEYYALAKFVMTMRSEEQAGIASFDFIDTVKKAVGGDEAMGKSLFESSSSNGTCAASTCHGSNGRAIDFADNNPATPPDEYLDNIAQESPWEFIHKLRFGQPGKSDLMKGTLLATSPENFSSMQSAVHILAYAQGKLTPNIKRGGLLFDRWWGISAAQSTNAPNTRNETWKVTGDVLSKATIPITDNESWQCVQCHGWDYKGKDGIFGLDTTSKNYSGIRGLIELSGATVDSVIASISNNAATPDHNFSQYINSEDIKLIAQFIVDATNGIPSIVGIDNALDTTGNDSSNGKLLYDGTSPGNCMTCHGSNGTSIVNIVVTARATQNPPRFLHKVRYGHPGSPMIPVSGKFQGLNLSDAGDLLAFSKTLTVSTGAKVIDYNNADYARGGRLYDNWWIEKKSSDPSVIEPGGVNPLWVDQAPAVVSDSWRCSSCHGWDYEGEKSYSGAVNLIDRIENTLRPITYAGDEVSLQNGVFDFIKNGKLSGEHRYGETSSSILANPLSDEDIWDLSKFLLGGEGMIDSEAFLQSDGLVRARDTTGNGEGIYNGAISEPIDCSSSLCHATDGKGGTAGGVTTVDIFAIASPYTNPGNLLGNPWRFLHRIRFGKPGTNMPSMIGAGIDLNGVYDVHRYSQVEYYSR